MCSGSSSTLSEQKIDVYTSMSVSPFHVCVTISLIFFSLSFLLFAINEGGNYDSRFDVGKASGTLIVARPLDAEQKSNYNLTVEATDGTRTVSTQVIETLMKRLEADEANVVVLFSSCEKQLELRKG